MKFIITEHRLDKLIYSFIDEHVKDMFNRRLHYSFIVYSENTDNDYVKLEYDDFDGRLYIDKDFLMTIANMFGLTPLDAQLKIYDWFKWYEDADTKYLDTPKVSVYHFDENK